MKQRTSHRTRRLATARAALAAGVLATLATACGATSPEPEQPEALEAHPLDARHSVAPKPWTSAFARPAVLLAEEIYVEGPHDLLDHLATVQHPELTYEAKTTEEGFRQELRLASDVGGLEIKAQLDAWELVALKRLVVLRRPSWGPVEVRAYGSAWWAAADESSERRDDVLAFTGERGK